MDLTNDTSSVAGELYKRSKVQRRVAPHGRRSKRRGGDGGDGTGTGRWDYSNFPKKDGTWNLHYFYGYLVFDVFFLGYNMSYI